MPCTSQKLSQDQFFTLLIGTYELLCPKLPMAIISKPISVFISSMFFPVLEISYINQMSSAGKSPLDDICIEI